MTRFDDGGKLSGVCAVGNMKKVPPRTQDHSPVLYERTEEVLEALSRPSA